MSTELYVLIVTAISIAFLHTLTGPDHYVPFVALSKVRNWSLSKTIVWVVVCGCGHVWSSVLLGLGGAALGWSITKLGWLENIRGGIAGWALLIFGFAYFIWGMIRMANDQKHKHFDMDEEGGLYVFEHQHSKAVTGERHKVTPWVMFIIFLLGPCEPMIPLLFYPAAQNQFSIMVMLVAVYTFITLITMIGMVLLLRSGISFFASNKLEKYMHPIGGATILLCGFAMVFLGW